MEGACNNHELSTQPNVSWRHLGNVSGRDLMAAGVRPGPGLRQVLNALLEAVITGQTPNEKDALLAAAAQFSAS